MHLVDALNKKIGIILAPEKVKLQSGALVQLDGYNETEAVLCEVYARIGTLKSSQSDKVSSDILKMLLVENELKRKCKKHYCFASDKAAAKFRGKSWLASTIKKFEIEIHVFELSTEISKSIIQAQNRQVMINKD